MSDFIENEQRVKDTNEFCCKHLIQEVFNANKIYVLPNHFKSCIGNSTEKSVSVLSGFFYKLKKFFEI